MDKLPQHAHIVIVGGGVMGASTAYHLTRREIQDVVLLERQPFFGMGATGKCAGGIRYQFSTRVNIALSKHSLPMLDRFEEEIGQSIGRQRCGYLFLLTREEELASFRKNVALQQEMGVMTQWLTAEEVGRMVPQVETGDVLAGTFHPDEGLADPNSVVAGYVAAAARGGARLLSDFEVTGVKRQSREGFIVAGAQGEIACDILVNACGPWAAPLSQMVGVPLPITPIRRQMLTTTSLPALRPDFPFVIDFARSLYFHREGEGILTGMSNPDQEPGFDESVDEAWELIHMEHAIQRLPLLAEAGRVAHWAGLYEVTPDAHPVISAVDQAPGYYVVAGFSGHGFMHGPVAGLLMSELIVDGAANSVDIGSLSYQRFVDGKLKLEQNVI